MGRYLGIDYGQRRIGLAISDPTAILATPLTTLTRRAGKRPPWSEIERIVKESEVVGIVVGLPLDLSGADSDWTAEVREFASAVGRRTGLPVHLVDERLSSVRAERMIRGSGLPRAKREEKGRVDAGAAAVILQSFLDRGKHTVWHE